ncbi:hypothetical protein PACILC2_35310 [Paenibacillus cisolokensis]|uniref:Glycosyl hydrolase family 36 N-terminal domain-containing protein n=1 Tax=Paenibacillus cisolokensis TaxID=1658519 RepID=A0ABQ4N9R9_9BACL|nr:glycoside hydrolase family 36 N-terminal domain-containing protein [Paenibacillus cisolokensis]GIQ64963.1 hypothetical protein PACILC2_35310 [Paenibacillus cisolokensis]
MTNEIGFMLRIDGSHRAPGMVGMAEAGSRTTKEGGRVIDVASFVDSGTGVRVLRHQIRYEGTNLIEQWVTIANEGAGTVRIEAVDSIALKLPARDYETMHFTSGWGLEFESVFAPLPPNGQPFRLETRKGRSSGDVHPWLALFDRASGTIVSASVMWSGNWALELAPQDDGSLLLTGGLNAWEFWKDLAPGQSMESPHVVVVRTDSGDLNDISVQYARVGREYWYPKISSPYRCRWNGTIGGATRTSGLMKRRFCATWKLRSGSALIYARWTPAGSARRRRMRTGTIIGGIGTSSIRSASRAACASCPTPAMPAA